MIYFQTTTNKINLTNKGITFNETSDYFSDKTSKSFSFPFYVYLDEQLAIELGLIHIESVTQYNNKIYGQLLQEGQFYDAYILINDIVGDKAELTIYYGKETLSVFDKNLKQLNFPVINTQGLADHAKSLLDLGWPETSHNFPKIYRPQLKEQNNYTHFDKFVNNYIDVDGTWLFPENSIDVIDSENVTVNRNVMTPTIYLLEILKQIFAYEGLELRGDLVNSSFFKKIVYIPKNFMEQYSISDIENYSFSNFTSQQTVGNTIYNVYQKVHTPTQVGSYSLKMSVNMTNAIAQYFELKVQQGNEVLYSATSTNASVGINETLEINITNTQVFEPITVTMVLKYQTNSIAAYNNFTYQFKEGQLNTFPNVYALADYLPNMTAREFINKIKTWLNLKLDYYENAVYINFLEDLPEQLIIEDKTHLQDPIKTRSVSQNNLIKLTTPDNEELLVNKSGLVYNAEDYVDNEIEDITIEALALKVFENDGSVTAIYPDDAEDLMFALYNGTVANENVCVDKVEERTLKLSNIYIHNWLKWLRFRANAETYSESFYMHISEELDIKKGIYKYNKNHLMKSIRKKRLNKDYWKVDVTSETF